jgi:hydroxylamine reductase
MALLDKANTSTYGNPEITKVNIGVKNRPAILISGHDLKDLDELLAQAEPEGVDVYTHSEMLPAHYYPYFKKYKNLAGNYGNACIVKPKNSKPLTGPFYSPPIVSYPHAPTVLTVIESIPPEAQASTDFLTSPTA